MNNRRESLAWSQIPIPRTKPTDWLSATLAKADGLRVIEGHWLTGTHAAAWAEGLMIYQSLLDTLQLLREDQRMSG